MKKLNITLLGRVFEVTPNFGLNEEILKTFKAHGIPTKASKINEFFISTAKLDDDTDLLEHSDLFKDLYSLITKEPFPTDAVGKLGDFMAVRIYIALGIHRILNDRDESEPDLVQDDSAKKKT